MQTKYKMIDLMELIGGGTPKTNNPPYWNGDIPWISVKDFNGDRRYVCKTEKHVTQKGLENSSTKMLQTGDIIISARGTVGELAIISLPMAFNQSCYGIRAKQQYVDSMYLYYLMKYNIKILQRNTHGSVFDTITRDTFANIDVLIPSKTNQLKIASVLSSLDDKIELNNKINENLEQQAQALFKCWFVDLDTIPAGWKTVTLGNIAAIKTNSFNPLKSEETTLEHYSIPAFDEKHYPVFESSLNVKSNKYILSTHSVMISKLNPDTKRIWRPLCLSSHPVCSTEFIVYEAQNAAYKDFIYSVIDSQAFSDYLCSHTTGSTNSRQRATPKDTLEFQLLMPSDEKAIEFCSLVSPLYDLIGENIKENQSLAKLRDTLLPNLMSGEIDVSNVKI